MRHGRWWVLLALLGLGGCTTFVARQIEHPGHPNRAQLAGFRSLLTRAHFQREVMRTRDGVRIAYWHGAPRAYGVRIPVTEQRQGGRMSLHFQINYDGSLDKAPPIPARGSIVLLHPWGTEGSAMTMWALLFADAGYVVVMPDLRSHGESADAPVGYGPREATDIIDLVHRLQAVHRLPGPLYLLGASYGANVALFAAPLLPDVHGVIALEPYVDAAAVIRRAPASGLFGYKWLASWIRPREMDNAIARASRKLGLDLDQIRPGDALARTPVCTLLLRGDHDVLISEAALQALGQRSARANHVEVSAEGHLTLPLRTDRLMPPLLDWIAALPAGHDGACPGFTPLPFVVAPASSSRKEPADTVRPATAVGTGGARREEREVRKRSEE